MTTMSKSGGQTAEADDPVRPGLLSRLQRGDCDAYQELVEEYGAVLYTTALRITGCPGDAEDALQDTYLSAFENLGSFEERSTLKTWLTRVCINAALSRLRRNARRRAYSLDDLVSNGDHETPRWVRDPRETPEEALGRQEFRRLIESYLHRLSPALREVFVLRDLQELSGEETAHLLGISVPAVKTRLSRARAALRALLLPHLTRREGSTCPVTLRQPQPQFRQTLGRELLRTQAAFCHSPHAVAAECAL
jgi:RNA polymerase sigma-70 factor (ECF subfamily)